MGNSHSQASDERPRESSVLSSSRGSSNTNGGVLNANGGLRGHKRLAGKFASPGNRVLPQPAVEGVRLLKTTQNGHILHSGGTISGRRLISQNSDVQDNPDLLRILQQRRSMSDMEQQQSDPPGQLQPGRRAHSDPDIARSVVDDEDDDEEEDEGITGRSLIAISPSKAKIKSRKKAKAPDPPQPLSSSLPKDSDRPPSGRASEDPGGKTVFSKFKGRRSEGKSPAPTPPPPPPPPDYNSDDNVVFRPGSSYEKNRRNVEKWRLSKTDPARPEGAGQKKTTSSSDGPAAKAEPSVLAKDFKEELLAVAKRRASNGFARRVAEENGRGSKTPPACNGDLKSPKSTPKKQYYFSNFDALKLKDGSVPNGNVKKTKADKGTPKRENPSLNPRSLAAIDDHSQGESKVIEYILNDSSRLQDHVFEVNQEPEHYNHANRKAENRQRNSRSPVQAWSKSQWPLDNLSGGGTSSAKSSLSSGSDQDLNVNIQLRPTLPRKQMDIPRFSPTDAWRSLWATDSPQARRSDRLRSEASTDDGDVLEDQIRRVSRVMAPRRVMADRCGDSGISPDAGSPLFIHDAVDGALFGPGHGRRSEGVGRASPPDGVREDHWVPKEDLMDDSDSGSVGPTTSGLQEKQPHGMLGLQAKFTMPANMFLPWSTPSATMRTEDSSDQSSRPRGRLRKNPRMMTPTAENFNSLRNLRKALGLRGRDYIGDRQNGGIDSNWSLSRSAPNSLNIVGGDIDLRRSSEESATPEVEEKPKESPVWRDNSRSESARRTSSFSFSREGHVMYLPEYEVRTGSGYKPASNSNGSSNRPSRFDNKKSKKFSYMSTVRKEERKRLEERLAQEVAEKERLREKEIRWMNRVEEEFRKQRDKEKFDIRHQLRMLSLESKKTEGEQNGDLVNGDEAVWNGNGPDHNKGVSTNGVGKWVRRRDSDHQVNGHGGGAADSRNFSPPRPEPEGGRSSGDECRNSLENYNPTAVVPEPGRNSAPAKKRIYDQISRVMRGGIDNGEKCNGHSADDRRSLSPASQVGGRPTRNRSSSPTRRRSSSYDDRKVDHAISVFKKEALQRTNSGRTYESHSNYIYSVAQKKVSEVPKEGRYRPLEDSDSMSDELQRSRADARQRLPSGSDVAVKRGGATKPLLTVQPFGANKGYRPVPFGLRQQHEARPNR